MEKQIGDYWFYYGRTCGFALGFTINKYHWTLDLGLWYIGQDF